MSPTHSRALDRIPPDRHPASLLVVLLEVWDQPFLRNDAARAEAALDRFTPSTPDERQVVERSRRVVDNARRNGDELEVAGSLGFPTSVLNRVLLFPHRVTDQAAAGARAAEALAAALHALDRAFPPPA